MNRSWASSWRARCHSGVGTVQRLAIFFDPFDGLCPCLANGSRQLQNDQNDQGARMDFHTRTTTREAYSKAGFDDAPDAEGTINRIGAPPPCYPTWQR
jgi:hypothetical protein